MCTLRFRRIPVQIQPGAPLLIALIFLISALGCSRSAGYYFDRGNQLFAAGKYDDAAIQYRKALQKEPKSGKAMYRLGLVALEQNKFFDAYQSLTRAVTTMPSDEEAKVKLADASLALYLSEPNQPRALYDEVEKTSDQLLSKNPSSFDGLRFKGALRLLDGEPKEALDYFQKANQVKPMQHDLVLGMTQALFLDNRFPEGETLAFELIRKEPTFGPMYDVLYQRYRGAKRDADAEKILKLKVSNNPNNADFIVQLAEHYARHQQPSEMTGTLQPLLTDSKRFPQGALNAGDFYARIGNSAEAQRLFEQGAQNSPQDKVAFQKRDVDVLLRQGKRADATRIVDSILKDHPDDEEASRVHATLRMESGKPGDVDAALAEFGTLVKATPDDPMLRFNYGRCWLLKGDRNRAQAEFRETVRVRPDFVPALTALAKIGLDQRKPDDALRYVQQILAYQPSNLGAKQLGVDSLIGLSRYSEAQTEMALLVKQYPNNADVQIQLGVLNLAQKKYAEAEKIFRDIHENGQVDSRPAVGLADVYSAQQEFDRAIQVLNGELKRSPNSLQVRRLLAATAVRAGNYDLAITTYRELLSKQPKAAELHLQLGMVYETKGDHDSAIAAFQQAKELMPNQPAPVTLLAVSFDKAHRTEEARANYQRALQLQPENPTALNNLAYLMAVSGGNLDEALKMVQRALQKEPANPNYSDTLAYVYLKKKMGDSAIQTYNGLVRRYPKNSAFHYHLGLALLDRNDKAKAKAEFENALANQPSPDDELRLKELLSHLGA